MPHVCRKEKDRGLDVGGSIEGNVGVGLRVGVGLGVAVLIAVGVGVGVGLALDPAAGVSTPMGSTSGWLSPPSRVDDGLAVLPSDDNAGVGVGGMGVGLRFQSWNGITAGGQ